MKTKVTFSSLVKQEITSEIDFSFVRRKALLSAYVRINGALVFKNKETHVLLKTDNSKIARYIYSLLKEMFSDVDIHLTFKKSRANKTTYIIEINSGADTVLQDLEIDYFEGKIPKDIAYNDETIAGYIAGAFLAGGSINSPVTSNYHLEICVNNDNYAHWLMKLFPKYHKLDLEPKLIKRREKSVIYFKKSDQISNFLVMIGAPENCIEFENERVKRDFVNSTNRLINFDEANMKKASQVGKKQAKEIKFIDDVLGIHNLHNPKKELLCYLRLENKELSLLELANLMSEEMGVTISKSNVNHMFRSLHELYLKLVEVRRR